MLTPFLEGKFFRVGKTEPFTYETGTSDVPEFKKAVPSGSESGFKGINVLKPAGKPRHLFWVEWGVRDGCKYYIKIPTGTDRFGTDRDKDVGFVTNEKSPYYAPDPRYGFWLASPCPVAINAVNPTPFAILPKVWFTGQKWDLEEVKEADIITKLKNYERGVTPSIPFFEVTVGGVKYTE